MARERPQLRGVKWGQGGAVRHSGMRNTSKNGRSKGSGSTCLRVPSDHICTPVYKKSEDTPGSTTLAVQGMHFACKRKSNSKSQLESTSRTLRVALARKRRVTARKLHMTWARLGPPPQRGQSSFSGGCICNMRDPIDLLAR